MLEGLGHLVMAVGDEEECGGEPDVEAGDGVVAMDLECEGVESWWELDEGVVDGVIGVGFFGDDLHLESFLEVLVVCLSSFPEVVGLVVGEVMFCFQGDEFIGELPVIGSEFLGEGIGGFDGWLGGEADGLLFFEDDPTLVGLDGLDDGECGHIEGEEEVCGDGVEGFAVWAWDHGGFRGRVGRCGVGFG